MSERDKPRAAQDGAGALARVVEAEKQAAARIEAARAEAAALLAAARQAARQEAERADQRLQALHGCARKALKARQAEIDTLFDQAAGTTGVELSETEVDALVARMARRLTGTAQ